MPVLQAYARGLRLPGQQPRGPMQINWSHPLARDITYVRVFNGSTLLFGIGGSADALALRTGASFSNAPGGIGLTGGGFEYIGSANTFMPSPASPGSVFAFVNATWSPSDGVDHYILNTQSNLALRKYSDGNWYCGWNGGSDTRVVTSATGTFNAGDMFSIGVTWASTGSALYVKGKQVATQGSVPSGTTDSGSYSFGDTPGGGAPWGTSNKDGVYYIAFWNRVLTSEETIILNNDPYCFMTSAECEMPALFTASAPVTRPPTLPMMGVG